ncbi:biotin synthase [Polytolypa hystricis UAMH7299]|uniref:biotin synthase n=1 Tax=Polytolypa hystricis (strain UAMH7299) TaxID=1447883 RepID=A0A2B7Y884_POLH7|nr:biotin synthase [Polytolypa hystricis UAMH7299]
MALSMPRKRLLSSAIQYRSYGTVQNAASGISISSSNALQKAIAAPAPRTNWTREEIKEIYNSSLSELTHAATTIHRQFHDPRAIQMCTLMNIKVGGCSEDCSYCAQSSRYSTGLKASKLSPVDAVLDAARIAKENGSTRFCMGAAWRDMRGRKTNLRNIKQMIEGVRGMGLEACVTLGMIDDVQAKELKDAGLTAYNHNLDTSREFYPKVITTRSYDERLNTLRHVRDAGLNVCSGGILGLGESDDDRVGLLHTVSTLPAHPESFPVNALVPIKGTPLGERKMISFDKMLRTIAAARIVLPTTIVRLAAGRVSLTDEQQVMCFQTGANAVFTGEKMLTTDCNGFETDRKLFEKWGYYPMRSFARQGLSGAEVPAQEGMKDEKVEVTERAAMTV